MQLPSHMVVVKCEEFCWLPQCRFRPPYKNAHGITNGEYGTFPVMNTRSSITLVAKMNLNDEGEDDVSFTEVRICGNIA